MDQLSSFGHRVIQRMKTDWHAMRTLSLSVLIVRLVLVGVFAGLVAWLVALGLAPLFEISRPSGVALLFAILRGAVAGMIVALILHAYWKLFPDTEETNGR